MMTLDQFTSYPPDVQLDIIRSEGVLIGEREDTYSRIELFQLHAFYAEMFYRKEDNELWKAGGFDHPILLQPYLNQINLEGLMG